MSEIDFPEMNSEIQYGDGVHSDLGTSHENVLRSPAYRQTLHEALDEYLNNTNGEGFFYVGNVFDLVKNFNE